MSKELNPFLQEQQKNNIQ